MRIKKYHEWHDVYWVSSFYNIFKKIWWCYDSVIDELKEVNGLSSLDFGDTTGEPEYPYSFCRFDNYSTIEAGTRGYPDEIIGAVGTFIL